MNIEKIKDRKIMDLFPKVELHRHLEGSFCLETLFKIAQKNHIENTPDNLKDFILEAQFPLNHPPDFKVFLSKFRNDWYRSHEDVYELVYNSIKKFEKEHLFFLELRFSPEHFSLVNDFDRIEISKIIIHAAKTAAREIGLYIKFLITFNRNKQTQYEMLDLYNIIIKETFPDLIGIDLAGDEIINPPEEFISLFDKIHNDGVGITIHAGEVTSPEQVWWAINSLYANRIGHGTKSIEDQRLLEELVKRSIVLEQAPVSNSFTGSWVNTPTHPFVKFNKQGILTTLNSDDPTIQNTTLTDDFLAAMKYFEVDYQALVDLNIRAIQGSFISHKESVINAYKKAVQDFENKHL